MLFEAKNAILVSEIGELYTPVEKGGVNMSTLQSELMRETSTLSDESIRIVLDYVRTFIVPFDHTKRGIGKAADDGEKRKLGIFKDEKLLSEGYDFDESNDEIAEMFGASGV